MARPEDNATEPFAPRDVTGPLIGRTLGRFKLIEELGRGGSGQVFRAEQAQLARSAVVKVLRREVAAAVNRVERFLREAQLASRLDHPYAAHVYAFGAEPDGLLWIAMEYVRGETLDDVLVRRGAMPLAVFAPLFGRLCEVVHTAHELGIVHRDIKAANVMVIERAGQLLPKLLDFGIAKGADGAPSPGVEGRGLTGHGAMLGSPHYMAPEQWRAPGEVDARADVYALGVLAYRCATGDLPFADRSRAQLPAAHLEQPPPPLPARVPAAVAKAILVALAKRPEDRWPTALAFGEAITRAVGGATSEAVPIFDPAVRDAWTARGPQPIADAVAQLARAATTVEADAALRELVAIACRWLAVVALSQLGDQAPDVRAAARAAAAGDASAPWLALARTAVDASPHDHDAPSMSGRAITASGPLEALAVRLDDREHARTAGDLARDVADAAEALQAITAILDYTLVVGRAGAAEVWQGTRRRERERVVVWGEPLPDGVVALLDARHAVVARLSPLVQASSPLPSAEPELFLLWRSRRGHARLVAAPWGFERDDDAAAERLAALTTEDDSTHGDGGEDSPYPGLAPYRVDDARRFVGREREIEALANRLVRAPMLAVLGPSGVGKSSFLHAGVMARLAEHHELISMRPGRQPLHALAALPAVNGDAAAPDDLIARLRSLGERAPRGLVIVIDQLEELVTLCSDAAQRRRFAEVLAAAADGPSAPVRVVVTVRDDFVSVIESEPAFRGRFDVFVLATPTEEALRRIVTQPARRAGVTVDADVVDDMVAEVAGRPGSLPLLSFTASELWRTRDRAARRITRAAYDAVGGVAGALSTYADQIYGSLARRDQDAVRALFARLVAADGTRIPSPRRELEQLPGASGVLAHLIDARLLVVREDDGADVVELVHECLAERWDRLARWRSEDAADRALLADVRATARRWEDAGRRADLLPRGEALAELRRLAARSTVLTAGERAFITTAAGAARRSRRVRRALVAGGMIVLAGVALVTAYLGVAARHNQRAAEHNLAAARAATALAEDRLTAGLVAQGRHELNDHRSLAALAYFAEALRRGADTPGLRFMIAIARRGLRDEELVLRDMKSAALAALDAGFAIGGADGKLRLFDAAARPTGELALGIAEVTRLRAAGDRLVAVGAEGVAVIDLRTRRVVVKLPLAQSTTATLGPGPDEVAVATYDGIAVWGLDGTQRRHLDVDLSTGDLDPVWGQGTVMFPIGTAIDAVDLTTMQRRTIATDVFDGPSASRDGRTIGFLDAARVAHVLDGTGATRRTFRPSLRAEALFVSGDGERIGALGVQALAVYDAAGAEVRAVDLTPGDSETLVRLRDDDVWTGSAHGVIRHYHAGALVASIPAHTAEVEDLRLAGDHVLSAGFDASVVVERAASQQVIVDPPPCTAGSFTMSGTAIAHACAGGETIVHVGRHLVGTVADGPITFVAVDARSQRGAIVGDTLTIVDAHGAVLATSTAHRGGVAFEDADHLLVVDTSGAAADTALWRFTVSTQRWERLAAVPGATGAIIATEAGAFVATPAHLVHFQGARELARLPLANVQSLTASGDHRYLAAHLGDGTTAILDGATGALQRELETVESYGVAAVLDGPGDLVVRTSRGALSVWERTTGDDLVWNMDLLRGALGAVFSADGELELMGADLRLVAIPRETRPVAEILAEIACRVPLRVTGSRLEPVRVHCDEGIAAGDRPRVRYAP